MQHEHQCAAVSWMLSAVHQWTGATSIALAPAAPPAGGCGTSPRPKGSPKENQTKRNTSSARFTRQPLGSVRLTRFCPCTRAPHLCHLLLGQQLLHVSGHGVGVERHVHDSRHAARHRCHGARGDACTVRGKENNKRCKARWRCLYGSAVTEAAVAEGKQQALRRCR